MLNEVKHLAPGHCRHSLASETQILRPGLRMTTSVGLLMSCDLV